MKKLIHLQVLPLLAGVQNFSLWLIDGLDRDEYELSIASAPGKDLEEACRIRDLKHFRISCMRREIGIHDLLALLELILLFKRERFDIVHTNSSKAGLLGRLAARLCRIPLVVHTSHGMPFQEGQSPLAFSIYVLLEKLSNLLCDKVIYVNDSDRLRSIEMRLVKPSQAISIYNAITPAKANALEAIANRRSRTVDHELVIGTTIRFSKQKNSISLVISAIRACKMNSGIKFILLGEGEELQLCKTMVHSHGLNERIIFPGWDSVIENWLEKFDCFVLYSRWEAMPFSIIEAMHSGLPVIGSKIPSICELLDESSSYIVPLDREDELAELFASLPGRKDELRAKGLAGLRRIKDKCNYDNMIQAYSDIYRSL